MFCCPLFKRETAVHFSSDYFAFNFWLTPADIHVNHNLYCELSLVVFSFSSVRECLVNETFSWSEEHIVTLLDALQHEQYESKSESSTQISSTMQKVCYDII